MNTYGIVLFLHLCALLAAMSAGALAHLSEARMRDAASVEALRPWARLLGRLGRVFPVALLVLLGSGAYLVHRSWSWSSGWVDVSIVGVALLFASGGGLVQARGAALRRVLMAAPPGPIPAEARRLVRTHPAGLASWMNTGIAIAIVFAMTVKPAFPSSMAALAVGAAAGLAIALTQRKRHA
jgi:hypothetical protein